MGRALTAQETEVARLFAHAAAALASEAVAAVSRFGEDAHPTPAAGRALALACEQARLLDEMAAQGRPLEEAFRHATTALEAASVALAETKPRPWLHPDPPRGVAPAP